MTIRDIRELLRDWKALTGLIMLISAVVGSSGYAAVQHFAEDEVAGVIAEKEVQEWDTPLPTEAPPAELEATAAPAIPTSISTASIVETTTEAKLTPSSVPSVESAPAPPMLLPTRIPTSTSIPQSAQQTLPTPSPTATATSTSSASTPTPIATSPPPSAVAPLPASPIPTPSSTPIATATAQPTATVPLAASWIEWLSRAPAPIPEGNPDWVYDSMNGTIYGQVSHPDLLLDITMLQVNRGSCNALLYVVGDVGEPKNIPLYGAPLAAWVDKYGEGTEAPDFNLLARLSVVEYDAIAAQIGLVPYAETYGTTNLNPAAQREAEACAASANAETILPSLIHEYINAERAQEGLGALEWYEAILSFAKAHTDDMAAFDYFSHKDREGNGFAARWAAWEHDECSKAGENLSRVSYGVDQDDPELTATAMVEGWMGSERHRAAILTPEFTHTAIAVAYGYSPSKGKNYAWATQIFCTRKD